MKTNHILEKLNKLENILTKQNKKPLNLKEASAYLGFRPSYLYKLTHKKIIPFHKPSGKMLFFSKSELDEWIFTKSKDSVKVGVNQSEKLQEDDPGTTQAEENVINEEDDDPP